MLRQLHQNDSINIGCNVPMLLLFLYIFYLYLSLNPNKLAVVCQMVN